MLSLELFQYFKLFHFVTSWFTHLLLSLIELFPGVNYIPNMKGRQTIIFSTMALVSPSRSDNFEFSG